MRLLPATREVSFATVYDALYGDEEFAAIRSDFLCSVFDGCEPRSLLLDAGCGTGSQADALRMRGQRVVGLDIDPRMLTVARGKHPNVPFILADLRRLPFPATFGGIFCLESPLAYLLDDESFALALRSLRAALRPRGHLIIDTFDYPATLGPGRIRPRNTTFREGATTADVSESHSYDGDRRIWTMRQRFAVTEGTDTQRFEAQHRLRMRSADTYATALEREGFEVREMLAAYPGLPERLRKERRIIIVARAS
jgi:SAM-dependent methyltransferase